MKKLVNDQDASIDFEATSERNAKHNEDPLIDTLKGTMANYYVLPMILTFLRMSYALLNEKEKNKRRYENYGPFRCFFLLELVIALLYSIFSYSLFSCLGINY